MGLNIDFNKMLQKAGEKEDNTDKNLKCIISIDKGGKWLVLWHDRITDRNDYLAVYLDEEVDELSFEFDMSEYKPGTYVAYFYIKCDKSHNIYIDDDEYYGDFEDDTMVPITTYPMEV